MKRTYKPVFAAVFGCALFYGTAASGSTVDWTPLLASWEDGCAQSEEWGANYDRKLRDLPRWLSLPGG